ncbi:MAG: 5-(carboxyamino)imidazole ribonucleotide mutase [Promethearchaeia archaeon]
MTSLENRKSNKILVALIAGSKSDKEVYEKAEKVLIENKIPYELKIISAHRNPDKLDTYVKESPALVFIAVAGLAAALPGVIASKTDKPVIGVPVNAKLDGLDALLSIVQMPPGVPVACVGIDRGDNAAYLAIQILKLTGKI